MGLNISNFPKLEDEVKAGPVGATFLAPADSGESHKPVQEEAPKELTRGQKAAATRKRNKELADMERERAMSGNVDTHPTPPPVPEEENIAQGYRDISSLYPKAAALLSQMAERPFYSIASGVEEEGVEEDAMNIIFALAALEYNLPVEECAND